MLRLALIGDLHLSQRSPRYAHTFEVLRDVIGDEEAGPIDLFVLLGDLVEGAPSPREYHDLLDVLGDMADVAKHGVGVILGNHEHPETLCVADTWINVMTAWDQIRMLDLDEARILLIPYPRRGRPPFADLKDGGTIAGSMRAAADRIGDAVRAELADLRGQRPLIVLGHFTVEGMTTRDADFELHSASEVVVPQAALAGTALTALGHIHRAQVVTPTIIGVGSLIRHSWAERDDPKSYTVVTVDGGHVSWSRRDVNARPLRQFEGEWSATGWAQEIGRV
jgi:DNA repair exonuclease SbcCD nuclease subunit